MYHILVSVIHNSYLIPSKSYTNSGCYFAKELPELLPAILDVVGAAPNLAADNRAHYEYNNKMSKKRCFVDDANDDDGGGDDGVDSDIDGDEEEEEKKKKKQNDDDEEEVA